MTLTSTPMIVLLRLGSFLALAAMLTGCPSTSPLDAGDEDTGVEDDATVHSDGSMDALGPDADVHLRIDVPMVEVPADRPVPAACMVSAVVDLNARGAADGGVLRYVGDNRSALRTPSLPPTCVSSKINEGQYQVVHRYVPRISGRMRVSLDDPGTDASFDTVLSAQSECFALLPGERSLGCNNNVERSAAMRPRASEILTARVNAGAPVFIIVSGNFNEDPIVPQGTYALSVTELPEVALGAACDLAVRANACALGSSCLATGTPAMPRCVADGLRDTRCRVDTDPDCDVGLRCALGFCRTALTIGAPCGPSTNGVCPEGSVCQWVDGGNTCLRTGTRGADCRDEGTPCDASLACVHTRFGDSCRTAAPIGASCDPWGIRDACAAGSVCAFTATGGTCVAAGSVAGAPCAPSPTRCAAGLECILGPDRENEVCVRPVAPGGACDPLNATTRCTTNTDCAADSTFISGTCVAPGRAAGAPCQAVEPRCETGLTCSVATGAGRCQRALSPGAECDLRTGSTRCTGGGCVREGVTSALCRTDTPETEPNDAPAMATAISATGVSVSGALAGTDTTDCIRVTVPEGGSMVAETYTGDERVCALAAGDPMLSVFGPSGAEIARDDDSPGRGLCSTFAPWTYPQARGLPGGAYAVCVSRGDTPVPQYRLTVSVLP